jgi:molybdopterin converting factor small subunit
LIFSKLPFGKDYHYFAFGAACLCIPSLLTASIKTDRNPEGGINMIEVRLFATFREGRDKTSFFDPKNFKNAAEIIDHLRIPREEVAILLINGLYSAVDAPVKDGDVLALFPPVGGG